MNHQELLERQGVCAMSVLITHVHVFISALPFPALEQNSVFHWAQSSLANEKQSLEILYV